MLSDSMAVKWMDESKSSLCLDKSSLIIRPRPMSPPVRGAFSRSRRRAMPRGVAGMLRRAATPTSILALNAVQSLIATEARPMATALFQNTPAALHGRAELELSN